MNTIDEKETSSYTANISKLVSMIKELLEYCGHLAPANPDCECTPCRGHKLINDIISSYN